MLWFSVSGTKTYKEFMWYSLLRAISESLRLLALIMLLLKLNKLYKLLHLKTKIMIARF